MTIIGSSAFDGCNNLNELHISSLEAWCRIRFNDTPLSYANHLYMNGEEIKELIIPNTVTSIGDFAFYGSRSLTSVTIPNNVISIGQSSFYNCSSLLSVTIPNSVTSIGDYAFSRCRSLTSITIPNSVINIGNNAFSLCNLTSITFPKSVRNIGSYAFCGCSQLASITLPESIRNIGSSAFSGCKSLKEVHISNLALYCTINFEYRPFDSALHLYLNGDEIKDLVIPNSVPFIGSYAFCYCPNLKSVNISNSVTSIGNHAFDSCISLTSVKIPNSVTYIGDYSFYNCESLITLTIGNSVERLGSGFNDSGKTFASCPELTDVYCLAEIVPTMGSNAFQDSDAEYITLHVPATSLNSYKQAESWNVFKEIVPLEVITLEKCATPTITYENGEFRIHLRDGGRGVRL